MTGPSKNYTSIDTDQARIKGRPWYDVTAYGADPADGSADDTTAIQSAADAADENGVLFFPAASTAAEGYVITDTITFNSFLTIRGGPIPTKGWSSNAGGALIDATGVPANSNVFETSAGTTLTLQNLLIQGNTTAGTGDILSVDGVDSVQLYNVTVRDAPGHIINPSGVRALRLVSCWLEGTNYQGNCINNVTDGSGNRGAQFVKLIDSAFTDGDISVLYDATGHTVDQGYLQAVDCDFLTSGQESLKVVEQGDVHLVGCDVENGGQSTPSAVARFEAVQTLKMSATRMSGTSGVNQDTCVVDGCRNIAIDPSCTFNMDSGTSSEAALRVSGGDRGKFYGDYTSGGGSGLIVDDSALGAAYSTTPQKHSIMPDHIQVPGFGILLNTTNADFNSYEPKVIEAGASDFQNQADVGTNSVLDTDWVSV